ncbi:MAG: hypothetical protein K2X86_01720 [Cytophagaceae bacterium]|nr:hypothetical protein [Cytophagaceae bacterium]
MDFKKELVPLSTEESKQLKHNIKMSLIVFPLLFITLTSGTYLGCAPIFVPIFFGIVLVGGMALLIYDNRLVIRDIRSGKKEVITGRVIEKGPRSLMIWGTMKNF